MRWIPWIGTLLLGGMLLGCSGSGTPTTPTPEVSASGSPAPTAEATATPAEEPGWKTFYSPDTRVSILLPIDSVMVRDDDHPEVFTVSASRPEGLSVEIEVRQFPTSKRAEREYKERVADAHEVKGPGKLAGKRQLTSPTGTVLELTDKNGKPFLNVLMVQDDTLVDMLIVLGGSPPAEAEKIINSVHIEVTPPPNAGDTPTPADSPGSTPAPATPGGTPGAATGGASPGSATPGAATGGASSGATAGASTPGVTTGGASSGSTTPGATTGGDSSGAATPGATAGGASSGAATPGATAGGASSGSTTPGATAGGASSGSTTPGATAGGASSGSTMSGSGQATQTAP